MPAEAPTYVASKLLEYAARTSMEIEKPAGSKAGDLLCIFPYVEVNGKPIAIAGATEITPQAQSGTTFRQGAFWLIHDGTANKIKVTWEGSESTGCVVAIDAWRGVHPTTPIDVTSVLTAFTATKTPESPSITTLTKQTTQVVMEVNSSGALLSKTPAGFALRTNYSPATISRTRENAEATGKTTLEFSANRTGLMMSFALRATPVEGTAAGMGTGTGSASGVRKRVGVAAGTGTGTGTAAGSVIAAAKVVSLWELGELHGTTAVDDVGVNDGTYTAAELGKPSIIPSLPLAHAAYLGEGSYIRVPDNASLHFKGGLSIKLWYERGGDTGRLFARESNYELVLEAGGKLSFAFRDPAGEWHEVQTGEEALPSGKHRIDVTYDLTHLRILVDGVEVASAEFSQELRGSAGDIWIGVQPGGEFQFCHGRYQRIELRSGARGTAQILAEYEEEAIEVWADFNGDFETGNKSQYVEEQAPPERLTVVKAPKAPVAEGRYALKVELRPGDPLVAAGHRSELRSGKTFVEGDKRYFRELLRIPHASWDWTHWGIVWQGHDESTGSPPICWMLGEDKGTKYLRLQSGDSKVVFCTIENPPDDEWFELVWWVEFGPEGAAKVWFNGEAQTMEKGEGIDTLGVELVYDKEGVYRSSEAEGTVVYYFDGYRITEDFFSKPPSASSSRIAMGIEFPPDKLAVRICDPVTGATIARWAEDEPQAENVITGLRKTGEMPGGYKEMPGVLARAPRVDWPDLQTYADVFLEQPGGEDVWEGRLDAKKKSDGERAAVEPTAVGHRAALEDRKGIIGPGFINADLNQWGEIPAQRRANLTGEGVDLSAISSSVVPAGGSDPAGITFTTSALKGGVQERGELVFFGGGVEIGKVLYDFRGRSPGEDDADFLNRIDLSMDGIGTTVAGIDHNAATALQQTVESALAGLKYAFMTSLYGGGAEIDPFVEAFRFQNVRVLGDHGLPLRGTWPNVGFTCKQMLGYAVPLFTYLQVNEEELEDSDYVITHAWFSGSGDMASVVKELTKYELLDWFVFGAKKLQLRFPGTYGRRWQAYVGSSGLEETGEDGSRLWDRIMVRYTDVDGSTRTVGYPGSGAEVENEALRITDPDHPAVKAQIPREDLLELKGISTPTRALEAGERWLADANELSHAGEATLRGYVMDDKAVFRPVSQVQSGDWIRFPDAGSGGTGYRKIVQDDYDRDSRTCQVHLDAPSEAVQALLERMQAALIPLGL